MYRRSYGCDCSGPVDPGRLNPKITQGTLDAIERWTGDRPRACPWAVFKDPFVGRVLTAYRFYEKGQFSVREPNPSHRLVLGLSYYAMQMESVGAQRDDELRKKAEAERKGMR